MVIHELPLAKVPWQQLQKLLDLSFPLPPRDVFERVVRASHGPQRLWFATNPNAEAIVGLVMLSPHSKGGHLDNLVVALCARNKCIGLALVYCLLGECAANGPVMISLTTRIPSFFSSLGFQPAGKLADGSIAMLQLLPSNPQP